MSPELIAVIISSVISGGLLLWKFIKKIRKSKCYVENENGERFEIDFNEVEKAIVTAKEESLTPVQREALKRITQNLKNKFPSESPMNAAPKISLGKELSLEKESKP